MQNVLIHREVAWRIGISIVMPTLFVTGLGAAPTGEPIFSRVEILSATRGQIELRRGPARQLDLPLPECAVGDIACRSNALYRQVYDLRFTVEDPSRQQETRFRTEHIDRGRLLIAVDLAPQDETQFDDALDADARALTAASFSQPLAGMGFLTGALSQGMMARSARPAWICRQTAGRFVADLVVGEHGEVQRTYGVSGEVAERGCNEIARGLSEVDPEILQTRLEVHSEKRSEVRLRSASTLAGLTWSDRLAPLPAGVIFSKRALNGQKTGATFDSHGDAFRGHEGREGTVERNILMPATVLALIQMPMWVSEWRFTTTHESFGKEPILKQDEATSLTVAVIPIVDPLLDELARRSTPLDVPDKALVAAVMTRLEGSAEMTPDLIVAALADRRVWPALGDWLLLICQDDGTARYGIAPFPAVAKVTNAVEACAAVRRTFE